MDTPTPPSTPRKCATAVYPQTPSTIASQSDRDNIETHNYIFLLYEAESLNPKLKTQHQLWKQAIENSLLREEDVYLKEQFGVSNFELFAGLYYYKLSHKHLDDNNLEEALSTHEKALEYGSYHAQYDAVLQHKMFSSDPRSLNEISNILDNCCKLHGTPGYLLKSTFLVKYAQENTKDEEQKLIYLEQAIVNIKIAEKLLLHSETSIHNCYYGRSLLDATGSNSFNDAVEDVLRQTGKKLDFQIIENLATQKHKNICASITHSMPPPLPPLPFPTFLSRPPSNPSLSSSCSSARSSEIAVFLQSPKPR